MRYLVADYIYSNHGALPRGDDSAIRNATWGISYAYYPILSYMISAAFMGVASIFGASGIALLRAARMADVLFVTCAVYFLVKASGKLFPREKFSGEVRGLFTALAGFMPQAIFLGTYVNTDSLALMSAALILYAWASYLREDWTWKNSYDSCSWNGIMCIVLLQCIRLDIMQLFPFLLNGFAVQGRTAYAESSLSLWQRCGNCRCDSCTLRLVVCAKWDFI